MSFETTWQTIQSELEPGTTIRNWTVDSGYLGDSFVVTAISTVQIEVETPNATNVQKIPKREFEIVHSLWDGYCSGSVKRPRIRDATRFSKYIISLLHHVSG